MYQWKTAWEIGRAALIGAAGALSIALTSLGAVDDWKAWAGVTLVAVAQATVAAGLARWQIKT